MKGLEWAAAVGNLAVGIYFFVLAGRQQEPRKKKYLRIASVAIVALGTAILLAELL